MTDKDVCMESDNKTMAAALDMCAQLEAQPLDVLRMARRLISVMEWRVERGGDASEAAAVCSAVLARLSNGRVRVNK